jgi:hypothetical protein
MLPQSTENMKVRAHQEAQPGRWALLAAVIWRGLHKPLAPPGTCSAYAAKSVEQVLKDQTAIFWGLPACRSLPHLLMSVHNRPKDAL